MSTYVTVTPAYGRDYKTQKEAKADWDAGKDFRDARSLQYCSIRDFRNESPDVHVTIRYRNLTRTVNVR
jgi:hypothetical protein